MAFLNAEWRKLAIANYKVNPELIRDFIPAGTELDLWQGKCMMSLIGFRFIDTRILGVKVPYHVNFEEVNLRFYVKRKEGTTWKRAVVFIKEIVPRRALAFVANTIYKEHYEAMPMEHVWIETDEQLIVEYRWKKLKNWQSMRVVALPESFAIQEGTEEEFITEHYLGYTNAGKNKTIEYEVTHPRWLCYPVKDYKIDVDFGLTYGEHFNLLNNLQPASVMLAEGSVITVENKRTLHF